MALWLDLIILVGTVGYIFAVIYIPKKLKDQGKISKFVARKLVHTFAGLSIFITPYLQYPVFALVITGLMAIFTYKSGKRAKVKLLRELYEAIGERQEEKKGYLQGPFHYCLAIMILVAIFTVDNFLTGENRFYYAIAAALVMIISDTLAAIIGKRYGTHKVTFARFNTTRSLEGSMTFLISAWIVCFSSYALFGHLIPGYSNVLEWGQIFVLTTVTAVFATLVELFSPSTWDDLTVPIVTVLLMVLFAIVYGAW